MCVQLYYLYSIINYRLIKLSRLKMKMHTLAFGMFVTLYFITIIFVIEQISPSSSYSGETVHKYFKFKPK